MPDLDFVKLLSQVNVSNLISSALGAVVGLIAGQIKERRSRKRRQQAHWYALSAEVELCRSMAQTFLDAQIPAPLYRLSTLAYLNSFPRLLADGVARTEQDTRALTQFYNQVEALNRGLDQANEARGNTHKIEQEDVRNRLKAADLVREGSYYIAVREVLDRHSRWVPQEIASLSRRIASTRALANVCRYTSCVSRTLEWPTWRLM